jgi:hypothetical protein
MADAIGVLLGLVRAAIWPAIVTLTIVIAIPRVLRPRHAISWLYIGAFVVAYCVGHALEAGPDWRLVPTRNWQWMFYIVPFAGVAGAVCASSRTTLIGRCLIFVVTAALTAGLLTSKPVLWAPRIVSICLVITFVIVLWASLKPLELQISLPALAFAFALAGGALGVMISEQISAADGAIVAAAAAALFCIALGARLTPRAGSAEGLSLPVAVTLGGWAWIQVLSEARLWPLLAVPFALLALWLPRFGPLTRLRGAAALAVQCSGIVIAVVLINLILKIPAGG